jgi:hypothetical protein
MKALTQKGYDVNYSWGMNKHGQKFGGAIHAGDDALVAARWTSDHRPERHDRAVIPPTSR